MNFAVSQGLKDARATHRSEQKTEEGVDILKRMPRACPPSPTLKADRSPARLSHLSMPLLPIAGSGKEPCPPSPTPPLVTVIGRPTASGSSTSSPRVPVSGKKRLGYAAASESLLDKPPDPSRFGYADGSELLWIRRRIRVALDTPPYPSLFGDAAGSESLFGCATAASIEQPETGAVDSYETCFYSNHVYSSIHYSKGCKPAARAAA